MCLELVAFVNIIWIEVIRNETIGRFGSFCCGGHSETQKLRDLELVLDCIIVGLILGKHLVRLFFGSLVSQVKWNVWCIILEPIIV